MFDCYCDYDAPEFYERKIVKARKRHKCEECAGWISPGEQYEYAAGKWEGDFYTFKTCERCVDLYTWTKNNVPCVCPVHGNMDEAMQDAIDEACRRAPRETIGLRFGFLRRKVMRARHNNV